MLIDDEGKIFKETILDDNHDLIMKSESSTINPISVKLVKTDKLVEKQFDGGDPDLIACYTNFELIYGGINNVTLSLTYREFTIDDMARPSYYQNMVYETGAKNIRFKDVQLEILEVTNEKMIFKVLEDGLRESRFSKNNTPNDYEECRYIYERKRKQR